jgi:hypothetical protein
MNPLMKIMRFGLGNEGCLFCAIDKHPTATEIEKRFMYCHTADMARVMFGAGPVEFANPCRDHGHHALEAAPKLGEAMGIPPEGIAKVRDLLDEKRAEAVVSAGGGST